MKKIFILTGEPSGDKLAATVISKLIKANPNVEFSCVGGQHLHFLTLLLKTNMSKFGYIVLFFPAQGRTILGPTSPIGP